MKINLEQDRPIQHSKFVSKGEHIPWVMLASTTKNESENKKIQSFKACVHYFLSNFYFSPNDILSKTMKNVFYLI